MMIASLGYADLSAGDLQAALVAFDTARSISARAGEAFARTNCTYLLGVAHARALDWPHAKLHLERALAWNKESENVWNIHQCEAWLGAALAGLGAPDRGEALLEGALAFFEEHDEERMIHVCGHLRALTEVARAGWVEPDPPRVERAWARAQEAPEGARVQPAWGTLEAAYDHARALLEAAPDTTLEHNPDRTRFRLEGGDVINLARSHTARAVLHALLDDLAARPGEPIAPMDLFARAWPGQNIEQRAALMRLYVTINKLRKIGLDGIIETLDQGYRVRPHVRVEAVAEGL
jgi:tetratricopeptide (TPR) repeat protein